MLFSILLTTTMSTWVNIVNIGNMDSTANVVDIFNIVNIFFDKEINLSILSPLPTLSTWTAWSTLLTIVNIRQHSHQLSNKIVNFALPSESFVSIFGSFSFTQSRYGIVPPLLFVTFAFSLSATAEHWSWGKRSFLTRITWLHGQLCNWYCCSWIFRKWGQRKNNKVQFILLSKRSAIHKPHFGSFQEIPDSKSQLANLGTQDITHPPFDMVSNSHTLLCYR